MPPPIVWCIWGIALCCFVGSMLFVSAALRIRKMEKELKKREEQDIKET